MEQSRPGRIDDWNPAPEYIAENEPKQVRLWFSKKKYSDSRSIFYKKYCHKNNGIKVQAKGLSSISLIFHSVISLQNNTNL